MKVSYLIGALFVAEAAAFSTTLGLRHVFHPHVKRFLPTPRMPTIISFATHPPSKARPTTAPYLKALHVCRIPPVGAYRIVPETLVSLHCSTRAAGTTSPRPSPHRHTSAASGGSASRLSMQMEHPQWPQFVNYNLGKWSGRALHISADNGEYMEPFVKDYTCDVVEEGESSLLEITAEIDGASSAHPSPPSTPL